MEANVNDLDTSGFVKHRLYREHTNFKSGNHVKVCVERNWLVRARVCVCVYECYARMFGAVRLQLENVVFCALTS
jgi:hypothetical protein